jgi:hypothetical protein
MRSRFLAAMHLLPALARMRGGHASKRYLRKYAAQQIAPPPPKEKRHRRADGVREYSLTRRPIDERGGVPYLRVSGKWLERCGFPIGERRYLKAERGRLILTTEDPAGAGAPLT